MADEIKNVFISHVHEDDDGLADLKEIDRKRWPDRPRFFDQFIQPE